MKSITSFDDITLENILDPDNLAAAAAAVRKIRVPTGVDGMHKSNLNKFLEEHGETFVELVRNGRYAPGALRVIQKKNERRNPFLVPCVKDRFLQQAVIQVMWPVYEPLLSKYSFGYRPTNLEDSEVQTQAIDAALQYIVDGFDNVIKIDLNPFFRNANQSKILQLLSSNIQDGRVISLIHKMMKAPPLENGERGHKIIVGLPHGSIIRPLLSSIFFHELDQYLLKCKLRFVRHEDEVRIFVSPQANAKSIMANVTAFIAQKLHLALPKDKLEILPASKIEQIFGSINKHLPPEVDPKEVKTSPASSKTASSKPEPTAASSKAKSRKRKRKNKSSAIAQDVGSNSPQNSPQQPPKHKQAKQLAHQPHATQPASATATAPATSQANAASPAATAVVSSSVSASAACAADAVSSSVSASATAVASDTAEATIAATTASGSAIAKAKDSSQMQSPQGDDKHHSEEQKISSSHKLMHKKADGKYNLHEVKVSTADKVCTTKDLHGVVVKVQHRKKHVIQKPES